MCETNSSCRAASSFSVFRGQLETPAVDLHARTALERRPGCVLLRADRDLLTYHHTGLEDTDGISLIAAFSKAAEV